MVNIAYSSNTLELALANSGSNDNEGNVIF